MLITRRWKTDKQTFHQITSDSRIRYRKEEKKKNLAVSNTSGIPKQCDGIHGHGSSGKTNAIQFAKRGIHYDDPLLMSVREINIDYVLRNAKRTRNASQNAVRVNGINTRLPELLMD
ncbi:hypothetical protein CDAR_562951 [Caerostris darwini]|uniref:Uncharacterized protein n=1 Tax=Caerostris darwini TaxID=1538125 RepID=A0AAV4P0W7_9ARAC|nr:hypothetical protein CDAR_562951 [Caerostris darwini]